MKKDSTENEIDGRLREEAIVDSPAFSDELHERIMRRLADLPGVSNDALNSHSRWRIGFGSLSAAAMVLLAAGVWIHHVHSIKPTGPTVAVVPPSLPKFDLRFPALNDPLPAPITEARFGYLDRDAKNVMRYVVDHVDVIPAPPLRHG